MSERKSRTLFVRNLPLTTCNEKLIEAFEQVGPIKTAFVVTDKGSGKCKGYAFVQFSMLEDAVKAMQTVTHCDGRKIFMDFADAKKNRKGKQKTASQDGSVSQEKTPEGEESTVAVQEHKDRKPKPSPKALRQKSVKRCRLVIRNLSFKCSEADLKTHFEKFGKISEVTIPLKNGRESRGFGFVQFTQLNAAQKAVAAMNAQEILGRPVAVDWAVAKDRFVASTQHDSDKGSDVSDEEGEEGESEEEAEKTDDEEGESDRDCSSEEDDSDSSDGDGSGDTDGDQDSSDDDSEDSASKPEKKPVVRWKSDVDEGRTLFVRNIPFGAEEEEVAEVFQEFGDLAYTRLVVDKVSGRPGGTGFVQFTSKESAEQCLAKAQSGERGDGLVIQGRELLVTQAVSRTEAQSQKAATKVKEEKDVRNLFLAREGLIRAGTQAAIGISQEDMKKRMKVEQMKREKLKNINIFVSSTRLCIHNLPTHVSENMLKKVLRQTVDDSTMKITECRVMRNLERTNQKGISKSLGYAFVNFSTHEHAVKAVRGLNNSTVFGDHKRPIVEFSLENKKALEAKQKRLDKSKVQASKKRAEEEAKVDKTLSSAVRKKGTETKFRPNRTQDLVAKSMHTGPKGLPKRMGPKIRHRNRGKGDNQLQARKAKKGKKLQQNRPKWQPKLKTLKRKREEITDNVDRLVGKYQAKKARHAHFS